MIISRDEDVYLLAPLLDDSSSLSYDIETTGLNPRKDKIIGFGISNQATAFYVIHLAWDGEKLVEMVSKKACVEILRRLVSKKLITWNGSFDMRFTYHYFGVDLIPNIYSDGMLAKHTTDENGTFGLKDNAVKEFGEDATNAKDEMLESIKANGGNNKEFYKADPWVLGKYCMQDCILTYKLNNIYLERMAKEQLLDFFLNEEVMPLYREVTIPMELKGIPIDLDLMKSTQVEINEKINILEKEILEQITPLLGSFEKKYLDSQYPEARSGKFAQTLAAYLKEPLPLTATGNVSLAKKAIEGLKPWSMFRAWMEERQELSPQLKVTIQKIMHGSELLFNLKSKDQLRYLFFSILKETPTSFTDKGVPQVDERFLEGILTKYDFVPKLLEFNKLCKLESTYMQRFLEAQEDGIFYPSFNQHRTTSGRFGGDLQQLPRVREEDEETSDLVRYFNNKVRNFFIAGKEHKLVDADYNSLEVVVFADDAGDEVLLNMIKNDEDFYSTVAIEVHELGSKYSPNKKAENFLKKHQPTLRQDAKVYGLGIRYGMKDFKLSKTLNIDIEDAALIIDKYFVNFPKLKAKMEYYLDMAKTKGYVVSKVGRRRHIPRAKQIFEQHGDDILDMRNLYAKYKDKTVLAEMKKIRKQYNNILNNALNFPIQSLAASIVNQSSIKLARAIKEQNIDGYICMNVHDEICVRVKEYDAERLVPVMKHIMENTIKLDAPLTANPVIGNTYGEVK